MKLIGADLPEAFRNKMFNAGFWARPVGTPNYRFDECGFSVPRQATGKVRRKLGEFEIHIHNEEQFLLFLLEHS